MRLKTLGIPTLLMSPFPVVCFGQEPVRPTAAQVTEIVGHFDSTNPGSVLKRALIQQIMHRKAHGRFADQLSDLKLNAGTVVSIAVITADSSGLAMVATKRESRDECAVYVGTAPPPRTYLRKPDTITCRAAGP